MSDRDDDRWERAEAMERQQDRIDEQREKLHALLREAADELEGWVRSESQYANHDEDPSMKLVKRLRAVLEGKEP